ncbi:hypothetical protein [Sphingomonas crusticola]|uniref:hypothetical protein n=1 Tax=Sphingomonas crusticola TaxID=1697973 RepID=UPI0013C35774|nr:hypothetical protein [Sphingomonas crusticola]
MKATFLIAASLIVGTAAIAQTTTTPDASAPATTQTDSSMSTQTAPADASTTTAPAADTTAAPAPSAGMNAMPTPTTADMSSYPACSRTVHDHCVQHEGRARRR